MTVKNTNRSISYTSTGVTATFPYAFFLPDQTFLKVTRTDTNNVTVTLALTTDYTVPVSGVGNATGGSITLVAGIPPAGYVITISRVVPLTQQTNVRGEGPYNADIHETEFDLLCMADQQINDAVTPIQTIINPAGFIELTALTIAPAQPVTGNARIWLMNNGSGKATLYVQFATGPALVLATQA